MGGRYSHDRKKYDIATQVLVNGVQRSSFQSSLEASWAEFTPRLTVEYELSPSAMVYANYSQGYKAGGYNSRGTIPENVGPHEPESVTAYEVGLKSDRFDLLLRSNVAGFGHKHSDTQSSVTTVGGERPPKTTTKDAAAEKPKR